MRHHSPLSVEPLQLVFSVGERIRGTKKGCLVVGALLQFVTLQESEEESVEVPGLSALFSACTTMDAYLVVSVRYFLIQNQSLVTSYFFCLLLN